MSRRKGKDAYGDFWSLVTEKDTPAGSGVAMISIQADAERNRRVFQFHTPTQARALARALVELADEVDPDGRTPWIETWPKWEQAEECIAAVRAMKGGE